MLATAQWPPPLIPQTARVESVEYMTSKKTSPALGGRVGLKMEARVLTPDKIGYYWVRTEGTEDYQPGQWDGKLWGLIDGARGFKPDEILDFEPIEPPRAANESPLT